MNTLDEIDEYINRIVDYYGKLKGQTNLIGFLKKEIQCINDGLNLIDLAILPLLPEYIENSRQIVMESLNKDNFLEITHKQNLEIKNKLIKNYLNMTKQERNVYDCFILLFPIEIESQDLMIEMFVEGLLVYSVKGEDILLLLNKHFNGIIL